MTDDETLEAQRMEWDRRNAQLRPPICEHRFTVRLNIPPGTKWFDRGALLGEWPDTGQIWLCLVCGIIVFQQGIHDDDMQKAEL